MQKIDKKIADFFIKNNVDQMINRHSRFLVDSNNESVEIICIDDKQSKPLLLEDKEIHSLFLSFTRPLIENADGQYNRDLLTDDLGNKYMYHVIPYHPQGYDVMVQIKK